MLICFIGRFISTDTRVVNGNKWASLKNKSVNSQLKNTALRANLPGINKFRQEFSRVVSNNRKLQISLKLTIHRITGFLDFFHRLVFSRTPRFGNWTCFRPQVKMGEKTPTQLGPLERANL
jgi:hypothetical protein